ncbi:MAG: ROK family protein [Clostridia bacterium]|nr:ROK family protein [Clostridia bacterium]
MKFKPTLDKHYRPFIVELEEFKKAVAASESRVCKIAVTGGGNAYAYTLDIFAEGHEEENYRVVERLAKALLWVIGGHKIYLYAPAALIAKMRMEYAADGVHHKDAEMMARVYEAPFEIIECKTEAEVPTTTEKSIQLGGHLDGCRIGFDAGGSDRKVSAVVDGETVYSEEVVWHPKTTADWHYHYDGILAAMKSAAAKMPRVDAIGVSSAGVYVNNRAMLASLFRLIPDDDFNAHIKDIYLNVAKEIGAPIEVANDGDVTALAGSMSLGENGVLGIAMGTSEAGGYINIKGGINGWLNELAFVPVDFAAEAGYDEAADDIGVGAQYFSQDAVIKLAGYAGIQFADGLAPAEKLKVVQSMMAEGNPIAARIYEDIGTYLGYTVAFYSLFYEINHLIILGRVTSGRGGDILMARAQEVLDTEYPELGVKISMPNEKMRRVGQSIAAASLPALAK